MVAFLLLLPNMLLDRLLYCSPLVLFTAYNCFEFQDGEEDGEDGNGGGSTV